jgi:hypothetical protein
VAKLNSSGWTIAIALSGWLAALFVGVLDLPQKVHSFFENAPKAKEDVVTWWNLNTDFTGSWTNEGDVTKPADKPVALEMRVYGGRIDGEIWSDGLSDMPHPVLLLGGNISQGGLDAYAFDFINGKEAIFATFRITKNGDRLILKTLQQGPPFFSKEAELFRSPDALKDKPRTNFEFFKKFLDSQKKQGSKD